MPHHPEGVIVRVALLDAFYYGDSAVLTAVNPAGLDALATALHHARTNRVAHLQCGEHTHTFQSSAGANDIYLHDNRDDQVLWRLDPETIKDIILKLDGMRDKGLCHNYVDITTPAHTLVLSVDEYLIPNPVVLTSPFGYF